MKVRPGERDIHHYMPVWEFSLSDQRKAWRIRMDRFGQWAYEHGAYSSFDVNLGTGPRDCFACFDEATHKWRFSFFYPSVSDLRKWFKVDFDGAKRPKVWRLVDP